MFDFYQNLREAENNRDWYEREVLDYSLYPDAEDEDEEEDE